jgi:hypothetical protein
VIPKFGKVIWDEASTDLCGYSQAYGTRNPREAGYRLAHIDRLAVRDCSKQISQVNCAYTCLKPWPGSSRPGAWPDNSGDP